MAGIAINGGAGRYPDAMRGDVLEAVRDAADTGWRQLGNGALAAAVAAVRMLEDHPDFNAGVCSFPNSEGLVEMDALVLTDDLRMGAVAGLTEVWHPVDAALAVHEHPRHTLLSGEGARRFALEHGVETCTNDDLTSDEQMRRWGIEVHDTVGAVALDGEGRMALAVSTGGSVGSVPGRVGDVPIAGSSGYVVKGVGGACATGRGEDIMRVLLASRALGHLPDAGPAKAAERAVREMEELVSGHGGLVVMDCDATVGVHYNTKAMPWAWVNDHGEDRGGI